MSLRKSRSELQSESFLQKKGIQALMLLLFLYFSYSGAIELGLMEEVPSKFYGHASLAKFMGVLEIFGGLALLRPGSSPLFWCPFQGRSIEKTPGIGPFWLESENRSLFGRLYGGEGGIRTPDTLSGIAVFKTACFNRSHTSPRLRLAHYTELLYSLRTCRRH
jgi:hypothetical protein